MLVHNVTYTHLKPVIVDEVGKLLLSGSLPLICNVKCLLLCLSTLKGPSYGCWSGFFTASCLKNMITCCKVVANVRLFTMLYLYWWWTQLLHDSLQLTGVSDWVWLFILA